MEIFTQAKALPDDWDARTGDNPYLKKAFLMFLDQVDDAPKRYYLFRDNTGRVDSQFIWHLRQNYNISMFTRLKSRLRMNFIYMPLSVARPGIILGKETADAALACIREIRGWKMILNLGDRSLPGFTQGLTCPRCVLPLNWASFEDYLQEMRSPYRRRYLQALKKSAPLTLSTLADNRAFDQRLYHLYEAVFERAPYKLEKLSPAFFQGSFFTILVLELDHKPCGFVQLLPNGSELVFEFVGFDHSQNPQYDIYIRLLLEIVRYGIEHGYQTIDFGQTADEAKLKLGAKYEKLYAYVHHHHPVMNYLLKKTAPYLGYQLLDDSKYHVFRQDT